MNKRRCFVSGMLSAMMTCSVTATWACGPDFPEPEFIFSQRPGNFAEFAQGRIGIVQPTWYRSVLLAAYLALEGVKLTEREQQDLQRDWKEEFEQYEGNREANDAAIKNWLAVRKKIKVNEDQPPTIYTLRTVENSYANILNCTAGAFEQAADTLTARMKAYPNDGLVEDWINAQDQVFANCSEGNAIPPPVEPNVPVWAQNDRAYQIAAAQFYAMRYDEAKQSFAKIAQTQNSEWRPLAAYLLARVSLRQERYEEAEAQLNAVLANPELEKYHASAKRLRTFIYYRTKPLQLHDELSGLLTSKEDDDQFFQHLTDYRLLLDKTETYDGAENSQAEQLRSQFQEHSDMSDWIITMQSTDSKSYPHALERWRATKKPTWLVAALSQATNTAAEIPDLVSASKELTVTSTAFPSVAYYSANLLIGQQHYDEARTLLDALLSSEQMPLSLSTVNEAFKLRLKLAQNLDEFVHFAQRRAAGFTYSATPNQIIDLTKPETGEEDYYVHERDWQTRFMRVLCLIRTRSNK